MASHGNMKTAWSRRDGKNNKSYGASLQDCLKTGNEIERKRKPCRACGEVHHLEKCKVFPDGLQKRNGRSRNDLECAIVV